MSFERSLIIEGIITCCDMAVPCLLTACKNWVDAEKYDAQPNPQYGFSEGCVTRWLLVDMKPDT